MFAQHESDTGPAEHGPGMGSSFAQVNDARHRDGASYIDSMLAGTAQDPESQANLASPPSVPLS